MVESGQISAEEAADLLRALDEPAALPQAQADVLSPPLRGGDSIERGWARFWIYLLMAGGLVLMLGVLLMSLVYATDAARGWLVCGWLPMILGFAVILLALWSRRAPWLHVRISEGGRRKMALSFPLPLTLAAWGVRIAQPFVPQLRETGVDDLIIALRDSSNRGEPLFVDVEDDENGERVQVYFG
jgi:uncharacterized membrane protein HdeD (DUF308 family)